MEKYIFDAAMIVVVIIIVAVSAKRGFAISLLSTLSVSLAGFLSYKFTEPVSEFIYSSFLYSRIEAKFTEVLSGLSSDISFNGKLNAMLESLPKGFVPISESFGYNVDFAVDSMQIDSILSDNELVKQFIDNIAADIIKSVLEVIVFLILFVVLSVVLKNVSILLNKVVRKIPVVGKANTILGGTLGLIKSVVIVFVLCILVSVIINSMDVVELKNIASTSYVYRFVTDNNPFVDFI